MSPSIWKKLTGRLIREKPEKNSSLIWRRVPNSRLFSSSGRFLSHFLFVCIALGVLSFALTPAISSAAAPTFHPAELAGTAEQWQTAEKIWQAHQRFAQNGNWEKSREELEKIYQWKLNQEIFNHYPFSAALIRESQRIQKNGKSEEASALLDYAAKMAPDYSQVPMAQAQRLWSQKPFNGERFLEGLWYWVQGQMLLFKNFEEALPRIADLTFWVLLSLLITLAAFSFYLLVRFHGYFAHHLTHITRLDMSAIPFAVLSLLIAFAPFFLGLGWMFLFVFWLLIFSVYGGRSHRIGAILLFVFILLLPSALRFYSSMVVAITGKGIPEIAQANRGIWNADLHEKLLTMWKADPRDPDVLQALGLVEKRMGRFSEAEGRYAQWLQLEPDSAAAWNNLGNLYLATNRVDQAMETYLKAIRLAPYRSEAFLNLGQAYLMKLRLKEAEAEFDRAKRLKPRYVSYFTSISSRDPNRMAIDRTIEPRDLWKRVFKSSPAEARIAQDFWQVLWLRVSLQDGERIGIALIVLLGLLLWLNRRAPLIRNCDRCGRVFCSRCTRSAVMGNQCLQCLHAFTAKTANNPKELKRRRERAARVKGRRQSFPEKISLILPGIGHMLRGHVIEGLAYLFILVLFVTKVVFWQGWVPNPLILGRQNPLPWIALISILFGLYYIFVQVRLHRIRSKGGRYYFRTA
jgi:tetratricopeptide (TPR) repeat protein